MDTTKNILITGMSGLIGGIVGKHLDSLGHTVTALNRQAVEGFKTTQASITDFDAIRPAFDGIDTVIHLAAYLGHDDQAQLNINIEGTYNVFKAAGEAGVKRVIFGSSGATLMASENYEPYKSFREGRMDNLPTPRPVMMHTDPPHPERMYGVTKIAGEAMARLFSENHGSAIAARIGRVRAENRPADQREVAVHFGHNDIRQFFQKCVDAPDSLKWDVFYGVSDNYTRFRDLTHSKEVLGYEPTDGIQAWPLSN